MTALDAAQAQRDEDGAWAFWRAFADADLFLLLTEEPRGADLSPRVFELTEGRMVLVFDTEERMAGFSPLPVPYAVLPGRVLAALASGQGLAAGVNLGTDAPSQTVLPAEALAWLAETLDSAPAEAAEARPAALAAPHLTPAAEAAVASAVLGATGLAGEALLAEVTWKGGARGHVLAFPGVAGPDQPGLARAVAQALALSGLEAAALDVVFPAPGAELTAALRRVARRYLPPAPRETPPQTLKGPGEGPGMDKTRPPRLK